MFSFMSYRPIVLKPHEDARAVVRTMNCSVGRVTQVHAVRDYRRGVQRTARPSVAETQRARSLFARSALECDASPHRFDRQFTTLTPTFTNVTPLPMQNRKTRNATYGPWLVGLGAALWGTESAWRIPLNEI